MAANYDLVLLHGPKYCGRNILCHKLSSPNHERVCPQDYFRDNTVGLRDVILQVVNLLKKNKKVVVDDENATGVTRDSYVRMVHRKISAKTIASVKVLPANGRTQLLWSREYHLAENSCISSQEMSIQDGEINKWFSEESTDHINYCSSSVSDPCNDEGIQVFERTIPLTVMSKFKFEVPTLCLQWEGIIGGTTDDPHLLPEVVSICQYWSDVNPGGQIFVICDNTVSISGTPGQQQQENTKRKHIMQSLVKEFCGCPVYMFCMESPVDSGGFTKPPNPGMLAYLQRRHHLNIHTKDSVYLYQSPIHKVMAETAGMPHLKMSRAVHQPSLVASSHVFSIPNIPPFLKDMDLLPSEDVEQKPPEIPGINEISSFRDNEISMHLGYGRREFLFAKDADTITKFNNTYSEMASLSTDPVSKFSKSDSTKEQEGEVNSQKTPAKKPRLSRSLSTDRELPHWMMSDQKNKRTSQSKSPKPSTSRTDSTESSNSKYKKTIYVMTETELAEVAEDILKQAGREDLIHSIKLQKLREDTIKKHSDSTTEKRTKGKCAKVIQSCLSSVDIDMEEEEESETSLDEPASRCDIAPVDTPVNMEVTEPTSDIVPEDVLCGDSKRTSTSNTSVLDGLLISEEVRKRSPKKLLRRSEDTFTKDTTHTGHVHVCESSDSQSTDLCQKKQNKHSAKRHDASSNKNKSFKESTHGHYTEISQRKLPDLSILDEIFS
ncbi:uncharacterized protein LOC110445740 [Mizuhopecten yessoensis]|uniref:Uncharacterized protein n=1 Tax=Mizuhopecten yessoensis TaxID=6573 RepID=A0A210R6H2_MIZYE|nr:uncharacterized protein LOC110445740 [Mizuhopecten yessoensis]OWF56612.1 hypothetical protein KP79_PYT16972 [Mizuhopecten yessoensis]